MPNSIDVCVFLLEALGALGALGFISSAFALPYTKIAFRGAVSRLAKLHYHPTLTILDIGAIFLPSKAANPLPHLKLLLEEQFQGLQNSITTTLFNNFGYWSYFFALRCG